LLTLNRILFETTLKNKVVPSICVILLLLPFFGKQSIGKLGNANIVGTTSSQLSLAIPLWAVAMNVGVDHKLILLTNCRTLLVNDAGF